MSENKAVEQERRRFYRADDNPKWPLAILFGFQQVMVCVSALLVIPFILTKALCPGPLESELRIQLISSTFVASGISTIIQTLLGMRLALLQGTAFAYVPPVITFLSLYEYSCNATEFAPITVYEKLSIIQGCLLLSALIPMFIGLTGLVGLLTKFIGPITVTPLILLLVLSTVNLSVERMEKHWVSLIQAATLFATILYLADIKIRIPGIKDGKFHWYRAAIFGQYPYLIAILFSWGVCFLLTITNTIDENSEARTDKRDTIAAIYESSWFRVPYPAQFGLPNFDASLFFAFVVSALTSVFESVGDYHAIARVSYERSPPSHAINRGILAEGLGSFISGLIGPGVGLTTHTENIGVIGVTQVASRRTLLVAGTILIVLGFITKVGAVLSTIPEPLIGGVLATSMAMVGGVALANIQSVDLRNSRNISILGFSIMIGMIVPALYDSKISKDPTWKISANDELDKTVAVLLKLPMFIGALTACILDNTVPGATRKQRGLQERGAQVQLGENGRDIYDLPKPIMNFIQHFSIESDQFLKCIVAKVIAVLPIIPRQKRLRRVGIANNNCEPTKPSNSIGDKAKTSIVDLNNPT